MAMTTTLEFTADRSLTQDYGETARITTLRYRQIKALPPSVHLPLPKCTFVLFPSATPFFSDCLIERVPFYSLTLPVRGSCQ